MNNLHGLRYHPSIPQGIREVLTYILNKRAMNPRHNTPPWRLKYTVDHTMILQWFDTTRGRWKTITDGDYIIYSQYNRNYHFLWNDDFAVTFPTVDAMASDNHA